MNHHNLNKLLFPKSRFTVLGDINQTISKQEDLSLYEEISTILNRERSSLITMDKSFRCTSEILKYSTKFLSEGFKIDCFSRNGDKPKTYTDDTIEALDDKIVREILCRQRRYTT